MWFWWWGWCNFCRVLVLICCIFFFDKFKICLILDREWVMLFWKLKCRVIIFCFLGVKFSKIFCMLFWRVFCINLFFGDWVLVFSKFISFVFLFCFILSFREMEWGIWVSIFCICFGVMFNFFVILLIFGVWLFFWEIFCWVCLILFNFLVMCIGKWIIWFWVAIVLVMFWWIY